MFHRTLVAMLLLLLVLGHGGCSKESGDPAPGLKARPLPKAGSQVVLDFENAEPQKTPPDFTAALTAGGGPVSWVVVEDPSAPAGPRVLAQISKDDTNRRYPVCVYDKLSAKDVDVSVRFKPVSGKVDQAAGLVWRYRDKDNYYIVRANALENNVVLYKVERGVRTDLKVQGRSGGYGVKAPVPNGQWSTLRVTAVGDSFEVFVNDRKLFDVRDGTFTEAGKAGVWTKADSVTHFDQLKIISLDQR